MISTEIKHTTDTRERCNCLPTCTSIIYDPVVDRHILNLELIDRKLRKADEDQIYLNVKYEQRTFTSYTRSELFDSTGEEYYLCSY